MGIKKQEFYEGAALHLLTRRHGSVTLRHDPPCFVVNDRLVIYLKYSTRGRSPWGFTLSAAELKTLRRYLPKYDVILGLVCGDDGITALGYEDMSSITEGSEEVVHVSCYRQRHEHYEVNGPCGTLPRKIAPSDWLRMLDRRNAK